MKEKGKYRDKFLVQELQQVYLSPPLGLCIVLVHQSILDAYASAIELRCVEFIAQFSARIAIRSSRI